MGIEVKVEEWRERSNFCYMYFYCHLLLTFFQVHEIQVSANSIVPDPLAVSVNDVVAWTFRGLRQHDVAQIQTIDQVLDVQGRPDVGGSAGEGRGSGVGLQKVAPRRAMNRVFTEKGVYHFASRSFMAQRTSGRRDHVSIGCGEEGSERKRKGERRGEGDSGKG
jgi:plastocyanin